MGTAYRGKSRQIRKIPFRLEEMSGVQMKEKAGSTKRLRAAVVGGGICGLSTACSLRRKGIDVTVFEQTDALGEIGAGLTIFPNSLRQLERMGLGEALAVVGAKIASWIHTRGVVLAGKAEVSLRSLNRRRRDCPRRSRIRFRRGGGARVRPASAADAKIALFRACH